MNLSCLFDPGACASAVLTDWVNWFPFGSHGLMFLAGMIVGAVLGKWGVGALLVAFAALKFVPKAPKPDDGDDPIEHIPDGRPFGSSKPQGQVKRKRRTIFDR